METEAPVAKRSLYVINRTIPYFVKRHMLRSIAQMAVFATRRSELRAREIPGQARNEGKTNREIPGHSSTAPPNCRTSALSVEWQTAASRASGADFDQRRTATLSNTHGTTLHVRLSGESQARPGPAWL